jgi:elongation factor Ts
MADLYRLAAEAYGECPAQAHRVKGGDFTMRSYGELYDLSRALGTALTGLGLSAREHAAIISDNRPEWMLCDAAILLCGAADVPRAADTTEQEISFIVAHSDAVLVIAENHHVLERVLAVRAAARGLARIALDAHGDLHAILASRAPDGEGAVQDMVTGLIATIGENMTLRRAAYLSVDAGVVASYVHSAAAEGLGRIGVLVALESTGDAAKLEDLARKICMHVAATNPLAASESEVPADAVAREKAVYEEQVKEDPKMVGKPDNVIAGVIQGRIRKFLEEVVLLKQKFVMAPDQTVEAVIKAAEKDVGAPIALKAFKRFQLGEGVEKP